MKVPDEGEGAPRGFPKYVSGDIVGGMLEEIAGVIPESFSGGILEGNLRNVLDGTVGGIQELPQLRKFWGNPRKCPIKHIFECTNFFFVKLSIKEFHNFINWSLKKISYRFNNRK